MRLTLGPFYYYSSSGDGHSADGVVGYASQDMGPDECQEGEVYRASNGYGWLCFDTDDGGDGADSEEDAAWALLEDLSGMSRPEPELATTTTIAEADEWQVQQDADEQVHLLDGEGTVRATMPIDVWVELVKSSSA